LRPALFDGCNIISCPERECRVQNRARMHGSANHQRSVILVF
jgi:hypothetical protein